MLIRWSTRWQKPSVVMVEFNYTKLRTSSGGNVSRLAMLSVRHTVFANKEIKFLKCVTRSLRELLQRVKAWRGMYKHAAMR